jgi:hypothetical protein
MNSKTDKLRITREQYLASMAHPLFFKNSSIRVVNFGTSKIPVKGHYVPALQHV